ncbi:hypothetical protein [uncultured Bartonella sp.]|nr:hypothetical protein [uncultured Bartonella sp.]
MSGLIGVKSGLIWRLMGKTPDFLRERIFVNTEEKAETFSQ